jgi:hypothetical protein
MLVAYREKNSHIEFIPANQAKPGDSARCPYCGQRVYIVPDTSFGGQCWLHVGNHVCVPSTDPYERIDALEEHIYYLEGEIKHLEDEVDYWREQCHAGENYTPKQ